MVSSKINPAVNYIEHREIEEQDLGYSSSIYELDVYDITIAVVIGRPKLTYVKKNIIYFPIYIISEDDKIKSQIGVFEIEAAATDITKYTNENLDIDESKLGDPLLYSFSTKRYLERANSTVVVAAATEKPEIEEIDLTKIDEDSDNEAATTAPEEESPEEDVFKLDIKSATKSGKDDDLASSDGTEYRIRGMNEVFTISKDVRPMAELSEETEEDTLKYTKEYEEMKNTHWVEKFFKNNYYKIDTNAGAGDCFFLVIRDAFAQIGYITTVEKLRKVVADSADSRIFEDYKVFYTSIKNELEETKINMKKLVKINNELKKRAAASTNKEEAETILKRAKDNIEEIQKLKNEHKNAQEYITEFEFMEGVDSLEQLRRVMMTSKYWADTFAIKSIEKRLRVKLIILSKKSFMEKDLDSVLNCGESVVSAEGESFKPYFYIMTSYDGQHYELITYKTKRILKYREIPHKIKMLILNKCMERVAGAYNVIPDFVQLKEHYGVPITAAVDDELTTSRAKEAAANELFDSEIEFCFHASSANAKAGEGVGEKIPQTRKNEFLKLNMIPHWRRMLEDGYVGDDKHADLDTSFELHGKRWKAVEIYYQAAKFRKQNPDFFAQFSLDSNSEFCRDVELARIAGSVSGRGTVKEGKTTKKVVFRKKGEIVIDSDFYNGVRNREERMAALRAKFTQVPIFKEVLKLTKRALLKQFYRRSEPVPDVELMEVREEMGDK